MPRDDQSHSIALNVSSRTGEYILVPAAAAQKATTASFLRLRRCAVDISEATSGRTPCANLTVKDVDQSLLICGSFQGSAHVTAMRDSVLLVAARQLRLHDCRNCAVYLHVSSAPIIENCSTMRFAELPDHYASP